MRDEKYQIIALQLSFTIIHHRRDSPPHIHNGDPLATSTPEQSYV